MSAPQSNSQDVDIWKKGSTHNTDDNRRTEINIQRGIMEQVHDDEDLSLEHVHDDEDLSLGGENGAEQIFVVRPMA